MNDLSPAEQGFPGEYAPVPLPGGPPLGLGKFAIPQQLTFAGIVNSINHVYPYTFDEAMLHSRENADRMRFDPVIEYCLRVRMMAVALLPWHIEPDDPNGSAEVQAAADAERRLKGVPRQLDRNRALLDAVFVGRSAYQYRWRWQSRAGRTYHMPYPGRHIDGDKIVFHWDDRVGILVHAGFTGPTERTERGPAYFLTPQERLQLIVHQFEPSDPTFYRPMQAGSIHGRGLRHHLYWLWALKSRVWSLGIDFLEWFAQGLTAYYFESGNDAHMKEMKSWVEAQQGNRAILLPRMKDGGPGYKPVERFEAGTASSSFLQELLTSYFDDLIVRLILGQTLTTGTASTGLGSGVASAHQMTFEQIVKYDATGLQETLTEDYLDVFYRTNYPGINTGRWVFDIDSPNVQQMIENAQALWEMGAAIPEEPLMDAVGLSIPGPQDTVLSNVQPMQPAAVDGLPDGVPEVQANQGGPVQLSRQTYNRVMRVLRGNVSPITRLNDRLPRR